MVVPKKLIFIKLCATSGLFLFLRGLRYRMKIINLRLFLSHSQMGLQRRGNGESGLSPSKGRVYWRCYFNAVTCF